MKRAKAFFSLSGNTLRSDGGRAHAPDARGGRCVPGAHPAGAPELAAAPPRPYAELARSLLLLSSAPRACCFPHPPLTRLCERAKKGKLLALWDVLLHST